MDMNIDQILKITKEHKNTTFDVFTELEEFIKSEEMIMKPYIESFKNACSTHDWTYHMTSDNTVFANGCKTQETVCKTFIELLDKVKEQGLDDEEFLDILREVFTDNQIMLMLGNKSPKWSDPCYDVYNPYYQTFYSFFNEKERKNFINILTKGE